MGTDRPQQILFLDDWRGVHIPRDFAQCVDRSRVTGISDDDWSAISDPDSEGYWDAWQNVCDNATVKGDNGVTYRLYQEGALWLIPQGMEWDDLTESHIWPESESESE